MIITIIKILISSISLYFCCCYSVTRYVAVELPCKLCKCKVVSMRGKTKGGRTRTQQFSACETQVGDIAETQLKYSSTTELNWQSCVVAHWVGGGGGAKRRATEVSQCSNSSCRRCHLCAISATTAAATVTQRCQLLQYARTYRAWRRLGCGSAFSVPCSWLRLNVAFVQRALQCGRK